MEFLVQFEFEIPAGVAKPEIEERETAEAAAAELLADEGHLVRLWKVPTGDSPTKVLGLYRVKGREELEALLSALPLYEWMQTSITPLFQHPNDPAVLRSQSLTGVHDEYASSGTSPDQDLPTGGEPG
jgi:muconolactone delta-isomerase